MASSNEIINLAKALSWTERLTIVEALLRSIREEPRLNQEATLVREPSPEPSILSLAGIIDDEEAAAYYDAIQESRKIDHDGW
jgi:hypothetical protein